MHVLGLDPRDLKYILHTHGHIDHVGATKALIELFGCKTFIGSPDDKYVTGELDLTWARELDLDFIGVFTPDVILKDGDEVILGNTEITAIHSPGHTPGALSYFFDVTDGKKTYRAALHGGMGFNTMRKDFLDRYGFDTSCREKYIASQTRLAEMTVDIYLGNHAAQNCTAEKIARVLAGDAEAFVDSGEWKREMLKSKERMLTLMENGEI
jgi:metallo-beta-lactamase class B